ncbi:MAG: hypothetical protein HQK89_05375 [Nitrospirae bacterium]|nr:hypothetical protein [Nitrospirota bacterium]
MKRLFSVLLLCVFIVTTLTGCASMNTTGKTVTGAGIGAIAGGILGYMFLGGRDGAVLGAALGGLIGGAAGYIIGKYEEKETATRAQVYEHYPEYARPESTLPPDVKNLTTYLKDSTDHNITTIKREEPLKLCVRYDIAIGAGYKEREVEVVETQSLISPDGKSTPPAKEIKKHGTLGKEGCRMIEKGLPKNIPEGTYTHKVIVTIGDKTWEAEDKVLLVKSDGKQLFLAASTVKR